MTDVIYNLVTSIYAHIFPSSKSVSNQWKCGDYHAEIDLHTSENSYWHTHDKCYFVIWKKNRANSEA